MQTRVLATTGVLLAFSSGISGAAIIASDSFLLGGPPNYTAGILNDQNPTGASSGFSAKWNFFTGAIVADAVGLTHPLVTNPAGAANNGSLYTVGNLNLRTQRRPISTYTTTGANYYFSGLMSSSVSFATGTAQFGLSGASADTIAPTAGIQVGFTSGGNIAVFYKNAGGTYTSSSVMTYTAGMTYQFVVHLTTGTGLADVSIYDASGTLAGSLFGIATTTSVASDFSNLSVGVSANFNGGAPSQIRFDEFRFGTTLADVTVPEPSVALVSGLGVLTLVLRRRK